MRNRKPSGAPPASPPSPEAEGKIAAPKPERADDFAELARKAENTRGGPALEALERMAQLLFARGEPEQAIFRLEEAMRRRDEGAIDPRSIARIALTLATAHEQHLGRLDRAVALLEQAHKLDPNQARAVEAGRRIYAAVGDLRQVARLFEIELETAPPSTRGRRAELLVELAAVRQRLGDLPAAARSLELALPLVGNGGESEALRERLANFYASPGYEAHDEGSARQRAGALFRELAQVCHARGESDGEIAWFRRALGVNPEDLPAATGLEAAYRAGGRDEELQRLYRDASWLPGASRRLAELEIAALGTPGASPLESVGAAVDAISGAAAAGEDVDDLIAALEPLLSRPADHARLATLLEQLIAFGERDPLDRADRLYALSRRHKLAGDLVHYESALIDALACFPGHEEAYRALAEHLSARRDHATHVAIAEAALQAAPADEHAARLEELAELYDKRLGDVAGAIDAWRRRLVLGSSDRADSELRRLRIKEDRWAGLVATLEKELGLAVSSDARAEVLRRLGQVHRERHDLERARKLFAEALDLRPTDPSLFRTLGELAELEGRFEDLAALLRRQYTTAKERVEKLNLLRRLSALYEERLGDWDGVKWACEQILGLLPSDRDALTRLEQCHAAAGPEGAEALLGVLEAHANAAATPAEKIELYRRLAQQYDTIGRPDLAADRWERLLRLDKTQTDAAIALALAYEKLDRPADAALAYSRLLEDRRPRPGKNDRGTSLSEAARTDAWRRYARIVDQRLADPARAMAAWQQLLALRPADREAMSALTTLYRAKGPERALEELMERRLAVAPPEEAGALALELAQRQLGRGARSEARARLGTLLASLDIDQLRADLGRDTLVTAIELADLDGDARGAIMLLERLYFVGSEDERPALALAIAERWGGLSPNGSATLLAWERVHALSPEDPVPLEQLSTRYAAAGMPLRQRETDLTRLDLAEASGDRDAAVPLGESIARLAEEQLGDVRGAFAYLERVLGPPGDRLRPHVLEVLRAVTERGGLYGELARVLADEPDLASRMERALLFEERLREPRRAFEVLRAALAPEILARLGPASMVSHELLPHLLRVGERTGDANGVLDAIADLLAVVPRQERAALFVTRAEVREKRLKDQSGALDELLRAIAFVADETPTATQLDDEIRRLTSATRRYEDQLALAFHRAVRAARGSELRAAKLEEGARLAETFLRSALRALRVRLTELAQLADPLTPPESLRDEIWRLAAAAEKSREPVAAGARTTLAPLALRQPVPAPDDAPDDALAGAAVVSSRPARDPTLEVDVRDLVIDSVRPRRDQTMELQIGDLAEVMRGAPPPRPGTRSTAKAPPPLPRRAPPRMPTPLPAELPADEDWDAAWLLAAPALDAPIVPLEGIDGAWEEVAEVFHRADIENGQPTVGARFVVAEMWEHGAHKIDRAFDELRVGFVTMGAPPEMRDALGALAERQGAEDALIAVLDDAIADTASSDRAIALLLDSAAIRERQGQLEDAEARYRRALGIRPDLPQAIARLEAYYRGLERWDALAELLEERLHAPTARPTPAAQRSAQALELAELYERNGKPYDAISTLESLVQREPNHVGAFAFLNRLYEAQGQWGKVIEILLRRIDLIEAGDGSATQPEARRLRMHVAEIQEQKLERPERALETYIMIDRAGIPDPTLDASLERLYTQLGRWDALAALYERQGASEERDPASKVALLRQRIEIHRESAVDPVRLAVALRALIELEPNDDDALAQLERVVAAGPPSEAVLAERIELVSRRLQHAEATGGSDRQRAALLSQLGSLEAEAGRRAEAVHTLEHAVALVPDDPDALATLARLREGGEDWRGYAAAREQAAAVAPDDRAAARALLDAAKAELEHDGDRDRARGDLDRAAARCPEDPALLRELRELRQKMGDEEDVVKLLRRELSAAGADAHARASLGALLGATEVRRGRLDEAAAAFHAANEADPGYAPAVHGLADVAAVTSAWEEVEPLLRYAATRQGVTAQNAAAFYRRLAEAAAARGNPDEAYAALIEADRRQPGDLRTRVRLGRNRFAQGRFREAAQHLGAVAEHADLPRLGIDAASALYEGAVAELKLRRPERAEALLQGALAIDPGHDASLGLLSTQALARGDLPAAVTLLEQQAQSTTAALERAARWERVAGLARDELHDDARACKAVRAAISAWDAAGGESRPSAALLESLLTLERKSGELDAAAATASRLLQYGATSEERARRLRESASLDAALGNDPAARERLAAAHELDPTDTETLAGYSALLVRLGDDEANAQLLTRALPALTAPVSKLDRAARAVLWQRLAEARDRMRDSRGAGAAFERVLDLDPSRRPLRLALLERYGDDPSFAAQALSHRRVLLEEDPLDIQSLRALERALPEGERTRIAVVQALQSVAGALAVGRPIPIGKNEAPARPTKPILALDEKQLATIEHADAHALAEAFSALYEGLPIAELVDLAALGVSPDARISPVGGDPTAEIFADCARIVGNKRTALYLKDDPTLTRPLVMARPPTAVVISPALATLPVAELRFHLGRALWFTRPEHAVAVALPRERLNGLFMSAVRAFHPHHADAVGGSEDAQRLRRELPYKVVRRLAEIFQREVDTSFSSARWRRGVEHSAARAGLIVSGDFRAAARVLRDEGDDDGLRELARYALSPGYLALLSPR